MILKNLAPSFLVLFLGCAPSGEDSARSAPPRAMPAAPAPRAPASDTQGHPPASPSVPEPISNPAPEESMRVGGEVLRQLLKRVQPDFSKFQNRTIRPFGTPIYEATITAKGDVTNARVIRSSNLDIDAEVIAALRQCKFRPATRNGKPVAVYYTLTIDIDVH